MNKEEETEEEDDKCSYPRKSCQLSTAWKLNPAKCLSMKSEILL